MMAAGTVELRNGRHVQLRPLRPDDRDGLRRAFEGLSPESRYRRFFTSLHELRDEQLDYLVNVDHHNHEAILAAEPQTGEVLGVARYVRVAPEDDHAEAAVAVVDDWQGHGLGRVLLERLADRARAARVTHFTALVQADNRRALEVLSQLGPTSRSMSGEVVELDIELPERGLGAPLLTALRAAAGAVLGTRPSAERLAERARELWSGRTDPVRGKPPADAPVLVGTDGSETAARAVASAAELARHLGAPLHIVSAYRPGDDHHLRRKRTATPPDVGLNLNPRAQAEAAVAVAVSQIKDAREPTTHVVEGDPALALIDIAEKIGAQLLVVGNRGMTGAARFLLGSVPNRVAHHAPCSVLIVRTTT